MTLMHKAYVEALGKGSFSSIVTELRFRSPHCLCEGLCRAVELVHRVDILKTCQDISQVSKFGPNTEVWSPNIRTVESSKTL